MTTVPILLYHSIGSDTSGPLGAYSTSVSDFRDQMAWVRDEGYDCLTVGEYSSMLAGAGSLPARPLLITFDDGLADFLANALPVLTSLGLPCTHFVSTAGTWRSRPRALAGRPTMSWSDVASLPDQGVEVGGHGHEHLQLDLLPALQVASQLRVCKDLLEQATQREVTAFAYPHGYNRAATRRLVERSGFTSACAVKNELSHLADNRWALGRVMITTDQSVPFLREAVGHSALPLSTRRERLRSSVWRAVRLVRTRGRPLVAFTDV
ncbi:MAG TPA: polysaccharide deacetylase family protein [Propionibacteriaceae bacterium]